MAFTNGNDFTVNITADSSLASKTVKAFFDGVVEGSKKSADSLEKVSASAEKVNSKLGAINLDSVLNNLARLGRLAGEAFDQISHGSDFNDLKSSLDDLSKKAGTTGDALLSQLSKAADGTVSNFDLMQQAVKGLNADLDPKQIITLTEAARALGDRLGGDTKSKVEAFTQAVVGGNTKFLKSVGVYVDAKKANEDFAKSIGTTADKLSEEGQRAAFQAKALELLGDKTKQVGVVSKDAGDAVASLGAAYDNAKDKLLSTLAADEQFNAGLNELARIVSSIDFGPLIAGLQEVSNWAGDAAKAVLWFGQQVAEVVGSNLKAAVPGIDVFEKGLGRVVDTLSSGDLKQAKSQLNDVLQTVNKMDDGILKNATFAALQGDVAKINQQIGDLDKQVNKNLSTWFKVTKTHKDVAKATGETGAAVKKTTGDYVKHDAAAGNASTKTQKLKTDFDKFKESIANATGGAGGLTDFTAQIQDAIANAPNLSAALLEIGKSAQASGEDLGKLTQAINDAMKGQVVSPKLTPDITSVEDVFKPKGTTTDAGQIFGFDTGMSDALAGTIQQTLTTGLQAGIDAAFGGDFDFTAMQDLASSMAASWADYFLPGSGPIAGALVHGITGLFESKDSASTTARKSADKYFADIFDANRLSVVINGELKQISDLVFSGNTLFGGNVSAGGAGFFDFLKSLPAAAQAAFGGVGTAFEELLGVGEDIGGQLAAVFANNVGGSLNNLQLLVYATGKSFEELKNSVVDAFLNGKISAGEAVKAINGLKQVMTKGIPDGVGQTVQAFNNLKAAGVKGGRAATDAIRDIAFEAHELGIKDIPGVIRQMVASGQVGAGEVAQVFDALASNGITSLDQLAGASDERLIGVVARLEQVGFAFKDPVDGAAALVDKLNELQNKDVTLNIHTNVDKNFEKAYELAKGGSSPPSSESTPTEDPQNSKVARRRIVARGGDLYSSTDAPPRYISEESGNSGSSSSSSKPKTSTKTTDTKASDAAKKKAAADKAAKEYADAVDKKVDSLKSLYDQIENVAEGSDRYKYILEQLTKGTIDPTKAQELLNGTYADAKKAIDAVKAAERDRNNVLKQLARGEDVSAAKILETERALQKAKAALEDFGKSADKIAANDPLKGFFNPRAITDAASVITGLGDKGTLDPKAAAVINGYISQYAGDSNKLGVILREVGVNAEDAKKLIIDSFKSGAISATQAKKAIDGVVQSLGEGIPDKVGAITEAFQSFLKDGTKGGAFTLDDLKDLFAEAKEGGINDIGTLQAKLVETGQFSAEQVAKLYKTLFDNNISTLDQAMGISDEVGIAIIDSFYQAKGGISDTNSEVQGLLFSLNKLQKDIYVAKVEIQTTVTGDGAGFLTSVGVVDGGYIPADAVVPPPKKSVQGGSSNKNNNNKNNNKNNKNNNRSARNRLRRAA